MNRKIAITILGLMAIVVFLGAVNVSAISASIEVTDLNGNPVGDTITVGSTVNVRGTYVDSHTTVPALMEVYFNDGSAWKLEETLFDGEVGDGDLIEESFTVTKVGTYQFRWTCGVGLDIQKTDVISISIFHVPEPGTVAGLLMGLSAFGLLAVKKLRLTKR